VKRPTTVRLSTATITTGLALAVMIAALVVPACGKKGRPLPPIVRLPVRPDPFVARRLGSAVYLQIQVPSANADGTTPADIERVEVYGFTGQPPGAEDFFKRGALVATVPVRKPAEESAQPKKGEKKGKGGQKPETWPAPPPRPPASMENGFDQGNTIVVTEPVGPAQLVEVVMPVSTKPPVPGPARQKLALPTRFYVAVGVNRKGRKGPVSARQAVILEAPASAPLDTKVTHTETEFTISWTPPADARPPAPSTPPSRTRT
jgi:hypothetical protein